MIGALAVLGHPVFRVCGLVTGGHDPVFQSEMFQLVGLKQRVFCHLGPFSNGGVRSRLVQAAGTGPKRQGRGWRRIDTCVKYSKVKGMNTPSNRQRGSKDIWLDAAYDLLITQGINAVKVMPLAKKISLTRTGFYWFFKDIGELHDAMVQRWESLNTAQLVERCSADASNICEALFNLMDCWLDPALFDAPLDIAVRNWARANKDLNIRVQDADRRRIEAVIAMFARHGFSKEQARVRGMTVIYAHIGYISMYVEETRSEKLARVQHYVELFAGVRPLSTDIEPFLSRHQVP